MYQNQKKSTETHIETEPIPPFPKGEKVLHFAIIDSRSVIITQ